MRSVPADRRARRRRLLAAAFAVQALAAAAVPAAAPAHGLVVRPDLPIPGWLFGAAAGAVLTVSFAALYGLWRSPRLERARWRPLRSPLVAALVSRPVDIAAAAVGVGLLAVVVWSGFVGSTVTSDNFAPTYVYVIFWVALVPLSVVFGDVFRAFNPWRALGLTAAWLAERASGARAPAPLEYPRWLGRWPAAVGILCFSYMEVGAGTGAVPLNLGIATLIYTVVTLAAMSLFGVEAWLERGEAFSVYFNLFARVSPLARRGGTLGLRPPLAGLAELDVSLPGTVPLLAVMLGAVTFDGTSAGPLWAPAAARLVRFLTDHGIGATAAPRIASAIGLATAVLLVYALYELGVAGARLVGPAAHGGRLDEWFAHALVPIAVAYVGAHYLTLLVTQGQAIVALASDPLGRGWDVFGTAGTVVNYGILGVTATWYLQVLLVVGGHVAGLTAAHDRALVLYRDARQALRSQYWMLAVMLAFTFLALLLLAQMRL